MTFLTPTGKPHTLLLVTEDQAMVREIMDLGIVVIGVVQDADSAVELARKHRPDLACVDVAISGGAEGIKAAERLQDELGVSSVLVMVCADELILERARLARPVGYLTKPFGRGMLRGTLEVAFSHLDVEAQLATQRESLEAEARDLHHQLLQSSKMEAVGTLTGGVAHDFNNMLLPILGYAEFLAEALKDRPDLQHQAEEIRRAAGTASSLSRQLLAFSRRQVTEKEICDLHEVIRGCRKMLGRLIGEAYDVEVDLHGEPLFALIDRTQIEQVLMNLCINARDSMKAGGCIHLRTQRLRESSGGESAEWIRLTVEDEGCGMTEETRARIFEPFFSTKGESGTGLGLAMVQGIALQHEGRIAVDSQPGNGTTIRIDLPLRSVVSVSKSSRGPERATDVCGGQERILVVEDEPQVRIFVTRALENKGYRVDSAPDLHSARRLLDQTRLHPEEAYDLILSDCVLPDGSGPDLVISEIKRQSSLRGIISTGYSERELMNGRAAELGIAFLQKPYPLPKLFQVVRQVLDGDELAMAS